MFIDLILTHIICSICIIVLGTITNICIIIFDVTRHGALTGFSLVGIVAVCAVAAVAFVNQHKLNRFIHLTHYRRNRNQGGAADGDLTNWLLVVVILTVLFFLLQGRCSA
jgi:hypothetical protein